MEFLFKRGKVSSKGWVVIPKEIRDEMGLQPGDEVQFALWPPGPNMKQDRALYSLHVSRVPEDPVSVTAGMFIRHPGEPSLTELTVREHREEVEREEREIAAAKRGRRPAKRQPIAERQPRRRRTA